MILSLNLVRRKWKHCYCDEMLTPDSSRFWPADGYEPGHGQPSFDKQFARDWLKQNEGHNWTLPQDIVDKTIEKYFRHMNF